ncbi:hypothetical protein ELG87_34980 (plasmid) [Rhizobium leguminosarum]|nr:hypothetical protein ELG87_34980 [Rhizobium leguminosarum]TBG99183.1 hypothetical protein ELG68_29490 [Rhizobium leguminosarum]TBH46027.1 hypothetical protein ELG62_35840 [Rhizobium leguminosarum]
MGAEYKNANQHLCNGCKLRATMPRGASRPGCLQQMIDAAVNGHGIAYVPEDLVKQQLATGYWCRSGTPGPRIEILPADRDDTCASDATTCPCCQRPRPASSMDDDGCGICDECLAP